jgi:Protein involved in formate dehydrogenase formation
LRRNLGGPGEYEQRLGRARTVQSSTSAAEPVAFLIAVLVHQRERARSADLRQAAAAASEQSVGNRLLDRYPLIEMHPAIGPVADEIGIAVSALQVAPSTVPDPLVASGAELAQMERSEQTDLVGRWLDDPATLDARLGVWIAVAAGPILEQAAAKIQPPSREDWGGRACPMCGDIPQCAAIVEESGGFMQGAPRYLICGRCATWWGFPRAVCPNCGEDDSRRISSFVADAWSWARVDACDSCHAYIKTFDLRAEGSRDVVPLVDDVATLALDLWAHEKGLDRPRLSLAGV